MPILGQAPGDGVFPFGMRFVHFLLLLLCLPCVVRATDTFDPDGNPSIDFLYINANAGEAAGGHTALRVGTAVFHYQFFPDQTFLLVRESWDSFRVLYNDLHNRSIAIATLPLEKASQQIIRNHFTELLARQQQFFDTLAQVRNNRQFLHRLLEKKTDFGVSGLGFFVPSSGDGETSDLRESIVSTLGADFLPRTMEAAEAAVRESIVAINRGGQIIEQQLLDALSFREALRVLAQGSALDRQALIAPMAWEERLQGEELKQLQEIGNYFQESILSLLQSSRPDRGETLLLQTARYLAVRQSLATSRLVTLDPFFEGVRTVGLEEEDIEDRKLVQLQNVLQKQASRRRVLFFQEQEYFEIGCSLLETSRARAWELSRVSDTYRLVRILARPVLPSKPATVFLGDMVPARNVLQARIKELDSRISSLYRQRDKRYAYNLVSRNCATELIRSLNTSFPNRDMAQSALGGWLAADDGLLFIPFLLYSQVTATFAISSEQFLAARRLRDLQRLYREETDLGVWLRESNTLSSTLYEPRTKDTPFLFFTDDSFLLRPLLGVANVGYAALHGVVSLFTLPFDGTEGLNQAGRGIFYSLPELLFGNIRKGSYPLAADVAGP